MISVSPLSGYKNITKFVFSNSLSSSDSFVNWGDGSINYFPYSEHYFSDIGNYNVYGGACSETSAFAVKVYDGPFFTDKILVTTDSISSLVSTYKTFNISLSSSTQKSTVFLYASGSSSLPYQENRNFWSHLNPEWEFRFNDKPVSEIEIIGSPVYSGDNLLGYSATSAVQFLDDMPGNITLFFTVKKSESNIPLNSNVYSSISHSISGVIPDKLVITSDGINPLNKIQWSDNSIPYVISVGSSQVTASNILHYLPGSIVGINARSSCFGSGLNYLQFGTLITEYAYTGFVFVFDNFDYQIYTNTANTVQVASSFANSMSSLDFNTPINLTDDNNCFPTGGYTISNMYYPTSALPDITYTHDLLECNYDPSDVEFIKNRKSPKNVTLSATGNIRFNNVIYTLTGVSNPFDIVAFENRHDFYRKGEDYNVYDIIKQSLPFDLNQYTNLDNYLSAVAGEGDTLGKAYDKIHNFANDHSDIEVCNYDKLANKAAKFDFEIDDFGLELPEELKRIFNFTTIPLQKLIGTRCVCNTNFADCKGCVGSDICKICKFDKRSNLGDFINLTDFITAGDTIMYKENGGQFFNFLPIQAQSSNVFRLNTLSAEPIYSKGVENFCFYKWDRTTQNNPVESVVNYKDERNMLNPNLSSGNDWYADNGVVEEMFNYILTKNLVK
jgi:hypothetical protein